jgi:DNA-binding MarR family transcriptional regulator
LESKLREQIASVNSATSRTRAVYAAWAKKKNINYHELLVLYVLHESGNHTQKQMCDEHGIAKQTINNIIVDFVKNGYIQMVQDEKDKREKVIILTEKGREYARELISPLCAMEEAVAKKMGAERIRLFAEIALEFGNILEEEMRNADV